MQAGGLAGGPAALGAVHDAGDHLDGRGAVGAADQLEDRRVGPDRHPPHLGLDAGHLAEHVGDASLHLAVQGEHARGAVQRELGQPLASRLLFDHVLDGTAVRQHAVGRAAGDVRALDRRGHQDGVVHDPARDPLRLGHVLEDAGVARQVLLDRVVVQVGDVDHVV